MSKRQTNASSAKLRPATMDLRLSSTICESLPFKSLSIKTTAESGKASAVKKEMRCSMLSSKIRNSSLVRSGTRWPVESLTVTGESEVGAVGDCAAVPLWAGVELCAFGGTARGGGCVLGIGAEGGSCAPRVSKQTRLSAITPKETAPALRVFRGLFTMSTPNFLPVGFHV